MSSGFFPSSTLHKQRPVGLIPKCGQCGLFKSCQSPKMKRHGEGGRRILFVGEAPGEKEDERGRPFVGKAGQFLRGNLRDLGFDLDNDGWVTNACICRPPGNKMPEPKQVSACFPNLRRTLLETGPLVVVTLGRTALSSILTGIWDDIRDMGRWVGWQIPVGPYWICPTYHPSYLLRSHSPTLDQLFRGHLEAALDIDRAPEPLEIQSSTVECLIDDEEACEAIREIKRTSGWVAVDYETNCIKPEWPKGRIYSCALSNGKRTISYPWTTYTSEATGQLLRDDCYKIASNLKMEERWTLRTFGHGVHNWGWDVMLAAHCLDNRPGICSLKFQSLVRLGIKKYNAHIEACFESRNGPYNRIHDVKLHDLLHYGGLDAYYEHVLAMLQQKDLGFK